VRVDITFKHKGHFIKVKQVSAPTGTSLGDGWYCAYTKKLHETDDSEYGGDLIYSSNGEWEVTYDERGEVGFDTAHSRNMGMSDLEKFIDAVTQAVCYLNDMLSKEVPSGSKD
jgi:hypothetical protein